MQKVLSGYAGPEGYEKCSRLSDGQWRKRLNRPDLPPYSLTANIPQYVDQANMIRASHARIVIPKLRIRD